MALLLSQHNVGAFGLRQQQLAVGMEMGIVVHHPFLFIKKNKIRCRIEGVIHRQGFSKDPRAKNMVDAGLSVYF